MTVDGHYPTGFQVKSKTTDGTDPSVEYFRKGSAASRLSVADFNREYFGSARHLHLSGVAAALSGESLALCHHAAREMRAMGKTISFDPNLRPVLWPSREVMIEQLNQLAFAADCAAGVKRGADPHRPVDAGRHRRFLSGARRAGGDHQNRPGRRTV